jgi:hypothetical protein
MKKCSKTVHIPMWLLVLLTLQHHYIQCTNNFLNFDDYIGAASTVAQLHQYIGATDIVAPMFWCNCASSINRRRHTNILKI